MGPRLSAGKNVSAPTMTMTLTRRVLNSGDGLPGHEAAVVNQQFASRYFPNDDPIGRRILLTTDPPTPGAAWTTIVGVAPNVRQRDVREPKPDPVVYLPYRADPQRQATLLIRTVADPAKVTASVRDALRLVEPDLPLFRIETMEQTLARQRWQYQVFGSMFAIFAVIALVLSSVGLYAVTAYSVTQRTQEIGIRMALGARPRGVLWLVLRRALIQLAIGLPIGIAGAFGVGKILQSLLVQTSPADPLTPWALQPAANPRFTLKSTVTSGFCPLSQAFQAGSSAFAVASLLSNFSAFANNLGE
jgi:hypothetical protein